MTEPDINRTPKKQEKFLRELMRMPNVARAARLAKVARSTVYEWRDTDEKFAAAWDEALDIGIEYLEEEAHRRAFNGVVEPIYWKGVRVGRVRKFSDTLAIFLLKAHRPEKYREQLDITSGGKALKAYIGVSPDDWDEDDGQ